MSAYGEKKKRGCQFRKALVSLPDLASRSPQGLIKALERCVITVTPDTRDNMLTTTECWGPHWARRATSGAAAINDLHPPMGAY